MVAASALSALDLRGGAQDAARDLVLNRMPKIGVKPDVVSYSLAIAACFHAGSDADDLILAARRAAGVDKRSNAKKPKRAKKKKSQVGDIEFTHNELEEELPPQQDVPTYLSLIHI